MKKIVFILFFIIFSFVPLAAEDTTPAPYDTEELPVVINDLRRFEIITLGAMPFVALDASFAYSGYKYASGQTDKFPNPFGTSAENGYTVEEQKALFWSSLGISAGIGLTDFLIRFIKRTSEKRKVERSENNKIYIKPIVLEDDEEVPPITHENEINESLEPLYNPSMEEE